MQAAGFELKDWVRTLQAKVESCWVHTSPNHRPPPAQGGLRGLQHGVEESLDLHQPRVLIVEPSVVSSGKR